MFWTKGLAVYLKVKSSTHLKWGLDTLSPYCLTSDMNLKRTNTITCTKNRCDHFDLVYTLCGNNKMFPIFSWSASTKIQVYKGRKIVLLPILVVFNQNIPKVQRRPLTIILHRSRSVLHFTFMVSLRLWQHLNVARIITRWFISYDQ